MQGVLDYFLFSIGDRTVTVGQLIMAIALVAFIIIIYRVVLKTFFPRLFQSTEISNMEVSRVGRILRGLAILCFILAIIVSLGFDWKLFSNSSITITISTILKALIFLQAARLLDWTFSNLFIHNLYTKRDENKIKKAERPETEYSARKTVQYIFYAIVCFYLLTNFNLDQPLIEREIDGNRVSFRLSNIVQAILIILIARLIVWVVTQLIMYNFFKKKDIEIGSQYAINQLIKYIIYTFAIIMALDVFGINMNILLGAAAALLVGIGLGLQQTFNDFVSGLVLLFERSVSVGDLLEVDGQVGMVKKIGLRSSTLETMGNVSLVVPNHKLVNENVINWNHDNDKVRFHINLGVAYGTDTKKVKEILLKVVRDNPYVIDYPAPFVRFQDFGKSSLDFSLYFFSRNLRIIEDVKSDIRLEIDLRFRENNISIPFPQREVRITKD